MINTTMKKKPAIIATLNRIKYNQVESKFVAESNGLHLE